MYLVLRFSVFKWDNKDCLLSNGLINDVDTFVFRAVYKLKTSQEVFLREGGGDYKAARRCGTSQYVKR